MRKHAMVLAIFLFSLALYAQTETSNLEVGKTVERDLKGGETHQYRIPMSAAQFLNLEVNQKGIDVVVSIFNSANEKKFEIDSPNGAQGKEIALFLNDSAGDYILNISSPDKNAPSGKYEVKIVELRNAVEKDKNRIAAEKLFREAEEFIGQDTAASFTKAIQKYQESLEQWRIYGDKRGIATTLNSLGLVLGGGANEERAFAAYTESARLFEEIGDPKRATRTRHNIGLLYKVNNPRKALEFFKPAAEAFHNDGDRIGEPVALNNVGECYVYLSEYQSAQTAFEQALVIWREQKDVRNIALAVSNLGVVYGYFDNLEKEKAAYEESLNLRASIGDKRGQALAYNNLGFIYEKKGEMPKSIEFYEQALAIRRAIGAQREEAITLRNMANVYRKLGQIPKAIELYHSSLKILQSSNDLIWSGRTLGSIGIAYLALGNKAEARKSFQESLLIHQKSGNKSDEAQMLYQLALLDKEDGNLTDAETKVKQSLDYAESLRATIFNSESRSGYFASAQDFFELYTGILIQQHQKKPTEKLDVLAFENSERARARSLLDLLNSPQNKINQGVSVDLLQKRHNLLDQFNLKTASLSRLLIAKNTEAQAETLRQELKAIKQEYENLQTEIRTTNPHFANLTQPQPLKLSDIQKEVLDAETILLEYSLGKTKSYLFIVTQNSVQIIELPQRSEIEEKARAYFDVLTARNKKIKFETAEEKQNRIAKADAELNALSQYLSQTIIFPAENYLNKKRLLIVSDGILQYIPFAALPMKNNQPLVADYEIVSLPSASTLAVLRKELKGRKQATKNVAVLADPVFTAADERYKTLEAKKKQNSPNQTAVSAKNRGIEDLNSISDDFPEIETGLNFPRLPFTRKEAESISALTPTELRKITLDFSANRVNATNPDLANYQIIHFATHSFLNSRRPELSGIVLSLIDENGNPQNGFLRADEIYNLNLPAELIVLSGCRTGLGKEVRGEGLVGLTRGFMYAGAKRVAVSLWDVNDEATAELMSKFYKEMLSNKKLSPASALRQAQLSMLKDKRWNHPYYWAGFILQGEPK